MVWRDLTSTLIACHHESASGLFMASASVIVSVKPVDVAEAANTKAMHYCLHHHHAGTSASGGGESMQYLSGR